MKKRNWRMISVICLVIIVVIIGLVPKFPTAYKNAGISVAKYEKGIQMASFLQELSYKTDGNTLIVTGKSTLAFKLHNKITDQKYMTYIPVNEKIEDLMYKDVFSNEYVLWSSNTKPLKIYIMDSNVRNENMIPKLYLDENDQTFEFDYNLEALKSSKGTYVIQDGMLIATTKILKKIYCFEVVDDNTMVFLEEKSADVTLKEKNESVRVTDGVHFILQD